ncbi:hypothetical protein [Methanobrevibacter sp.]|uniref:hypothetical protein n=1 Tax=Methanobrevibacter sp. TaxID=66852 RepID=UPI003866A82B
MSNETKYRLKGLALTKTETYENILLRLLNAKLNGREIDYLISDNNSNNEIRVKVDWGRSMKNILYYDNDADLKHILPEFQSKEGETFRENINKLDNLINILAILEEDEEINAGEVTLKRLT